MSHPEDRQWMEFLYEELDPAARSEVQIHLEACQSCQQRLKQLRAMANQLDRWKLDPLVLAAEIDADAAITRGLALQSAPLATVPSQTLSTWRSPWGWCLAAAAAALVMVSFAVGRGTGAKEMASLVREEIAKSNRSNDSPDGPPIEAVRALLDEAVRQSLESALGEVHRDMAEQQTQLKLRIESLLTHLVDEQVVLRRDLETLAIEAEDRLQRTHRSLADLSLWSRLHVQSLTPVDFRQ